MNYTRPGRMHVIVGGTEAKFYFTLWLFGHRFHLGRRSALDVDIGGGWMVGAEPNQMTRKRR